MRVRESIRSARRHLSRRRRCVWERPCTGRSPAPCVTCWTLHVTHAVQTQLQTDVRTPQNKPQQPFWPRRHSRNLLLYLTRSAVRSGQAFARRFYASTPIRQSRVKLAPSSFKQQTGTLSACCLVQHALSISELPQPPLADTTHRTYQTPVCKVAMCKRHESTRHQFKRLSCCCCCINIVTNMPIMSQNSSRPINTTQITT